MVMPNLAFDRSHHSEFVADAVEALERAQASVIENDVAVDIDDPLGDLERAHPECQGLCSNVRHHMQRRDYTPVVRFEAVGQAILMLTRQIGFR